MSTRSTEVKKNMLKNKKFHVLVPEEHIRSSSLKNYRQILRLCYDILLIFNISLSGKTNKKINLDTTYKLA